MFQVLLAWRLDKLNDQTVWIATTAASMGSCFGLYVAVKWYTLRLRREIVRTQTLSNVLEKVSRDVCNDLILGKHPRIAPFAKEIKQAMKVVE
jgi:hypothetical protein